MKSQTHPKFDSEVVFLRIFSILFGALLGFALIKFGNPVILDDPAVHSASIPAMLGAASVTNLRYWLLGIVAVFGFALARWETNSSCWLFSLPLIWLAWQFIVATHTVDAELTRATLKHFTACVICFYLGAFSLSRLRNPFFFWLPISVCFLGVLLIGFVQYFGGLEDSRRYFYLYIYPNFREVPAEFLKKIASDRIFSTLFYPNTLAGVILLLLPGILGSIWFCGNRRLVISRVMLLVIVGFGSLACLYWSGSKAGWLIALILVMVSLLRLPYGLKIRIFIVGVLMVTGLSGFLWKHAVFFERGATSVGARFDYWRAALRIVKENPFLGSGPGTFFKGYQAMKKPESEMARLTHNDYLQQASDSGLIGFFLYGTLVAGILCYAFPKRGVFGFEFSVWLGFLGWGLQSLVEFGLYVPAIGWTAFALMGWHSQTANPIDKTHVNT